MVRSGRGRGGQERQTVSGDRCRRGDARWRRRCERDRHGGRWECLHDTIATTDEKAAPARLLLFPPREQTGVPDDPTLSAPAREKTVTANEDGTYTVALNVTGAKSAGTGEIVTNQPLDIVLVLDVSGSMAEKIASGWNQPTKIDSLKTAVNKFINATAAENAKITDQSQRNRIALVKFAGIREDQRRQ